VLSRLREIALVEAVCRNIDTGLEVQELPPFLLGDLDGLPFA